MRRRPTEKPYWYYAHSGHAKKEKGGSKPKGVVKIQQLGANYMATIEVDWAKILGTKKETSK